PSKGRSKHNEIPPSLHITKERTIPTPFQVMKKRLLNLNFVNFLYIYDKVHTENRSKLHKRLASYLSLTYEQLAADRTSD
ncbi:hypothetical protein, partial [Geobacillus thermodenitrificans]|uniref:hypothetical protein n=1 Tax=Geobacillus thermodenitrificans TaxID=33940 RepID=UPI002E22A5A9|nr:hypothetical protein [Geobacillus thermodenitrificans]